MKFNSLLLLLFIGFLSQKSYAGMSFPFGSANTVSIVHLVGTGAAPTITAGVGAGTGGSASIAGNDLGGTITVVAGTVPTASAIIATMTFNLAYVSAPYCSFSPSGLAAGLASLSVYSSSTTAALVLNSTTTALTGGLTFTWNYHCTQ